MADFWLFHGSVTEHFVDDDSKSQQVDLRWKIQIECSERATAAASSSSASSPGWWDTPGRWNSRWSGFQCSANTCFNKPDSLIGSSVVATPDAAQIYSPHNCALQADEQSAPKAFNLLNLFSVWTNNGPLFVSSPQILHGTQTSHFFSGTGNPPTSSLSLQANLISVPLNL